jgi:uncharacterized protein
MKILDNFYWPVLAAVLLVPTLSRALPAVPESVTCAIADRQSFQDPDRIQLKGWIGSRIAVNEQNRLLRIDPARLLEGYRKRPGRQSWDGEHVGKWLHAATLAWVNTGDPALRQKLDYVVTELAHCQLEDGYLGTYLDKDRWTEWDVWAHKYNLIGLITYIRYTGNQAPLSTCRHMADLLCRTFGDGPGKRDLIKAGHHVGMAPTSVLEPMVLLYRLTGEPRYLEFCRYILRAWEQPNGPKIISTLLIQKRVDKVGNGKAYEMLSCLNGALEYYRTVGGDRQILDACLNAWQDIVDKRLYITGAASYGEHFHDDFDLPNVSNVGETCVTVTWLQFNAQLLRLTDEARFAEQLERVVDNQLFGAQRPDGAAWGYYVQMEGKKPYSDTLDGHCCLSSGPRGVALIPTFAVSTDAEGVVVNLFDTGTAKLKLRDGTPVSLAIDTQYPTGGAVRIQVNPEKSRAFALKLRVPAWCRNSGFQLNDKPIKARQSRDGYAIFYRKWKSGDRFEAGFSIEPRVVVGDHRNQGKAAVLYGPLVLAADQALLPADSMAVNSVALASVDLTALAITPEPAPAQLQTWPGAQVFRVNSIARKSTDTLKAGAPLQVKLIPFADAGGTSTSYRTWLPVGLSASDGNLLADGKESRSRQGNISGSIIDEDLDNHVVTFNGKTAQEDWFAVTLDEPVTIARIVFAHGRTFHDGGWFDASGGKPQVQVQITKGSAWETVGELKDYPATTATNPAGLRGSERFEFSFGNPVKAVGVRILGKPACGDFPAQAFSSCAELQAFATGK